MLGPKEILDVSYILDTSTLSEIFRSYYKDRFPSFWEKFDELVRTGGALSVSSVRRELENARGPEIISSVAYLRSLNQDFFFEPDEQEQRLVREMFNEQTLSSANNRWREKVTKGIEDADPYLIAKAGRQNELFAKAAVVTQEQVNNTANIPSVCQRFGVPCFDLRAMMAELGWRF